MTYCRFLVQVLQQYQRKGISLLGTVRSIRIQRHFERETFNQLIKPLGKKKFQRSIRTFEADFSETGSIQVYFFADKVSRKPVIFASNDHHLLPSHPEERRLSRNLGDKERPIVVDYYNQGSGINPKIP